MTNVTRRSGGRSARQALRSSKLSDDLRPIRPGMERFITLLLML